MPTVELNVFSVSYVKDIEPDTEASKGHKVNDTYLPSLTNLNTWRTLPWLTSI